MKDKFDWAGDKMLFFKRDCNYEKACRNKDKQSLCERCGRNKNRIIIKDYYDDGVGEFSNWKINN